MIIAIPDDYQNVIRTLRCFELIKDYDVRIFHNYVENEDEQVEMFRDAHALVLTRTRTAITESMLSRLPNLKVISQTGKNAGHIDVYACLKYGIALLESKGNPIATAELTWALIMNGLRRLPQATDGLKKGQWQSNIGDRVYGKTIGIWGYGKIGKRIARYAKAFDANVEVWGSETSCAAAEQDGFRSASSKTQFFSECDVVTLNLRLNEVTSGIVKLSDLQLMKPNALFVNTARAALIEPNALNTALKSGRPGFAALDVFDEEPIFDVNYPLLKLPNVICTPHIGYVEREGYELYFGQAFQNLLDWEKGNL